MKEFEIWMEGYSATGESSQASLLGTRIAETFDEAVQEYMSLHQMADYHCRERYLPRDKNGVMHLVKSHSVWGCRLFDNEGEARKSFG